MYSNFFDFISRVGHLTREAKNAIFDHLEPVPVSQCVRLCVLSHPLLPRCSGRPPPHSLPRAFLLPAREEEEEEDTVKVASRFELPLHSPPLIGLDSSFEPTAEQLPLLESSPLELFSI